MEWTKVTRENVSEILKIRYKNLVFAKKCDWGLDEFKCPVWEIGATPYTMAELGDYYYRVI